MVILQLTVFKVESVSKHFFPLTGAAEGERHEFWQNQKGFFSGVPLVKNKLVTLF